MASISTEVSIYERMYANFQLIDQTKANKTLDICQIYVEILIFTLEIPMFTIWGLAVVVDRPDLSINDQISAIVDPAMQCWGRAWSVLSWGRLTR